MDALGLDGLDDTVPSDSSARVTGIEDDDSLFGGGEEETTTKGQKGTQTTSDDSWFGGGSDEPTSTVKGKKVQAEETDTETGGLGGFMTALSPDETAATGKSTKTLTRGSAASSSDGLSEGVKTGASSIGGWIGSGVGIFVVRESSLLP